MPTAIMQMKTATMILTNAIKGISILWGYREVVKYKLTNNRQPRHLLQSTRQTAQEGYDGANNAENKRAGAVAGDSVHGDGEGQKMTRHDEDEE
jgi:hypothetical protein